MVTHSTSLITIEMQDSTAVRDDLTPVSVTSVQTVNSTVEKCGEFGILVQIVGKTTHSV